MVHCVQDHRALDSLKAHPLTSPLSEEANREVWPNALQHKRTNLWWSSVAWAQLQSSRVAVAPHPPPPSSLSPFFVFVILCRLLTIKKLTRRSVTVT